MHIQFELPSLSPETAAKIARDAYGIEGSLQQLPSERDQNFLLAGAFVLKIANASASQETLDLENAAMEHVAARAPHLAASRIHRTQSGELMTRHHGHWVRLLHYIRGRTWAETAPQTTQMRESLGRFLAQFDDALRDFHHPAAQREFKWNLAHSGWAREYTRHISSPGRRAIADRHLTQPDFTLLRHSVIHNDANDHNILVENGRVAGLIDFGDMTRSATAGELAIACAYAMMGQRDPLTAGAEVVRGYHSVYPLQEAEIEALFPLICLRLAVSVTNSAYQRIAEPGNEYLFVSEERAWALLEHFEAVHRDFAHYIFRSACGLPAHPKTRAVTAWLNEHAAALAPVVDADPRSGHFSVIDWSIASGGIEEPVNCPGMGRYTEIRGVYQSDAFSEPTNEGSEVRTMHLGLDIFLPPGSAVYAPLDGVVHSFANNAAPFDYGPCIILEHGSGPGFCTLYGHLSVDSLDGLYPGKPVRKGERIASIGDYSINGNWPPHLHLQIILDMLGKKGDYLGACRPSQKAIWTSLCPDPNLVVRAPGDRLVVETPSAADILEERRERIGYNLSVSYRNPLHIVRGRMQYLFDAEGQRYLDCVNNVAHVGHCHPKVVAAGQRQMALLNTNTRYLHELLGRYAECLTATLPAPLRVCYFVNSGSESNELALRLARAHTGCKDMLVVESGYHGNTTGCIDISPYKFDHKGGSGASDWVHKLPMPNRDHVESMSQWMSDLTRGIAGFICESILSCGGQVVLPDGYLRQAYSQVRAAGGLCIADEVQTGLGRVGTHWWAFETQGVTPDIVTMGKPIGNGHPLGAVVTTAEIAASFNNGLEYFNTFGGNPVSCAIGLAVLEVMREEGLRENALEVGNLLMEDLRGLGKEHEIIGEVRGLGLFIGLELVKDRETWEPATREAGDIVNRLRDQRLLASTDGPFENVIKIKPPLCFSKENASHLTEALHEILSC